MNTGERLAVVILYGGALKTVRYAEKISKQKGKVGGFCEQMRVVCNKTRAGDESLTAVRNFFRETLKQRAQVLSITVKSARSKSSVAQVRNRTTSKNSGTFSSLCLGGII